MIHDDTCNCIMHHASYDKVLAATDGHAGALGLPLGVSQAGRPL